MQTHYSTRWDNFLIWFSMFTDQRRPLSPSGAAALIKFDLIEQIDGNVIMKKD
jgi:hypothetical protein